MNNLWRSFKYATRVLVRAPLFTVTVILTIALGVGVNTAVFTEVNAVLLRPLPYYMPDQLVMLSAVDPLGKKRVTVSYPNFQDWKRDNDVFQDMAAFEYRTYNLTGDYEPERLSAAAVSANIFQLLGVNAQLGRSFLAEEDQFGVDGAVILGNQLWQRRFGSDKAIIGKRVTLDNQSYTVVGVMPDTFRFPHQVVELWTPLASVSKERKDQRATGYLNVIGRLKPNVTLQQAQARMDGIANYILQKHPEVVDYPGVSLRLYNETIIGNVRKTLLTLQWAVGLILVIVCVNVMTILLSRAVRNRRNTALKIALGASATRVTVQMLIENSILALLGMALGTVLALWGNSFILKMDPILPRQTEPRLDVRVLLFAALISFVTVIVASVAPVIQAMRTNLNDLLKQDHHATASTPKGKLMLRGLIIAQIAVTIVLTIGAGLMIKSLYRVYEIDPGLNPDNLLTMQITLPQFKYREPGQQVAFFNAATDRIASLPGAEAVGLISYPPFTFLNVNRSIDIVERPLTKNQSPQVRYRVVSDGYFSALGISVKRGREFSKSDSAKAQPVVIVNDRFERVYLDGNSPVGLHLRIGGVSPEVVGVVGSLRTSKLTNEAQPEIYVPYEQDPVPSMCLVVRSNSEPSNMVSAVRAAIASIDPNQPIADVSSMNERISMSIWDFRFMAVLLGALGAVALILSLIGIYGVVSYQTNERTHEIGMRMALGARPRDIKKLVLREGLMIAAIGVVIGIGVSIASGRLLESFLYGVSTADWITYAVVALLTILTTLFACYSPADRASRIDPMRVIRHD
jgi:putative ABC transport system permease protein